MKNFILAIIAAGLVAISCDSKEEKEWATWDIAPVEYVIRVVDEEGRNLLDPSYEKGLDVNAIEATYKGRTYLVGDGAVPVTKEYAPRSYGLAIIEYPTYHYDKREGYMLSFGELDGAESYTDEELVISWGNGTQDVVSFTRSFSTDKDGTPDISHKWFLNGVEYKTSDTGVIEIVMKDVEKGWMTWDIAPVEYVIKVVDAEGRNLLDPSYENSLDVNLIEAAYRDKTYLVSDGDMPVTKAYAPHFYGLRVLEYPLYAADKRTGRHLIFGELEGARSYENEELVISWGNGAQDVVSFTRSFSTDNDGTPDISHKWFLNGVEYQTSDTGAIEILK